MGLARDLTTGPRRKRSPSPGSTDYAALRRLTRAASPNLATFRTILERVSGSREQMQYAEGVIYAEACRRYRELTGKGPHIGTELHRHQ